MDSEERKETKESADETKKVTKFTQLRSQLDKEVFEKWDQ